MNNKEGKPEILWLVVSNIDMARVSWIWWVIEGTVDLPGKGSRSFSSFRSLQENVEGRGFKPPTAAQIEEAVLQARVDGKDQAVLQVLPTKSAIPKA